MKALFLYIPLAILLNSCGKNSDSNGKEMFLEPKKSKKYQFNLKTDKIEINFKITCNYEIKENSVYVTSVINEILYKDGSEIEKGINSEYQNYIDNSIISVFNKYGSAIRENTDKRVFNTELLIVEFPKKKIKEGDIWEGRKSANPDFIFKFINTKYKCIKIKNDDNIIDVEMTFEMEKDADNSLKSMTKFYKGFYVVRNDGTIKNAEFDITGFSGFSNMSGEIKIKEIK